MPKNNFFHSTFASFDRRRLFSLFCKTFYLTKMVVICNVSDAQSVRVCCTSNQLPISIHPFINPSGHPGTHSSVHPCTHPSVYPSLRPSMHSSIRPSIPPTIHALIPPSIHPSVLVASFNILLTFRPFIFRRVLSFAETKNKT